MNILVAVICVQAALPAVSSSRAHPKVGDTQRLRVRVIGYADRWADYGSRGDTPSFRDFLAVMQQSGERKKQAFIKLRFLYFPQDNFDPKSFAEEGQPRKVLKAMRDTSCNESFASLSRSGDVQFLDPDLKPSQFRHLRGAIKKLPSDAAVLPCYVVN